MVNKFAVAFFNSAATLFFSICKTKTKLEPEVYDTLLGASVGPSKLLPQQRHCLEGEVKRKISLLGRRQVTLGGHFVPGFLKGSGGGTFILICAIDPNTSVNSAV